MSGNVGVAFRRSGKVYNFNPGELELVEGDWVVVETIRGLELGQVRRQNNPSPTADDDEILPVKAVLRKAGREDLKRACLFRQKALQAFDVCREKILTHDLPMKLIEVVYTLDGNKIIFFFSAEGRVDFRNLVKDLATHFKKRIELHQIGVRDESKIIGGTGICGLTLCCSTHLTAFDPISIKMAKEQNLSLNPTKISGLCGRLLCCLRYEYETYRQVRSELPSLGSAIRLGEGSGQVVDHNIPANSVVVRLENGSQVTLPMRELQQDSEGWKVCPGCERRGAGMHRPGADYEESPLESKARPARESRRETPRKEERPPQPAQKRPAASRGQEAGRERKGRRANEAREGKRNQPADRGPAGDQDPQSSRPQNPNAPGVPSSLPRRRGERGFRGRPHHPAPGQ